jgi:hypothetical protein
MVSHLTLSARSGKALRASHPSNRYPLPCTVRIRRGSVGSALIGPQDPELGRRARTDVGHAVRQQNDSVHAIAGRELANLLGALDHPGEERRAAPGLEPFDPTLVPQILVGLFLDENGAYQHSLNEGRVSTHLPLIQFLMSSFPIRDSIVRKGLAS